MNAPRHCPCGSKKQYESCCGPLHRGERQASTCEELLRGRYAAFVKHQIDYVLQTSHPDTQREMRRDDIDRWSRESEWGGLEIIDTFRGGPKDDEGVVEFMAWYTPSGEDDEVEHHERAYFERQEGQWYFVHGEDPRQEPIRREAPKVGRNDPCPCGSGRKYKKCCGVAA